MSSNIPDPYAKFSREKKIKKYTNIPPHKEFQKPEVIRWFKSRLGEKMIKKSVYSLFPNNCEPMLKEDEITEMTILMGWLSHFLEPPDKHKDLWMNPKYFFNKEKYDKMIQLKNIFLQFDEDGSRAMELDEIEEMFNSNDIKVDWKVLGKMFFQKESFKDKDKLKLFLDFYQFMNFAMSKECDNRFREMMRLFQKKDDDEGEDKKDTNEDEKKINSSTNVLSFEEIPPTERKAASYEECNKLLSENWNKDRKHLPGDFKELLDYFYNKGEERKFLKHIKKDLKVIRNIVTPGAFNEDDPDFKPDEDDDDDEEDEKDSKKDNDNDESDDKKIDEKKSCIIDQLDYDRQIKEINFNNILEGFVDLVGILDKNVNSNTNTTQKQKTEQSKHTEEDSKSKKSDQTPKLNKPTVPKSPRKKQPNQRKSSVYNPKSTSSSQQSGKGGNTPKKK
ncbi:MAG: hypothetical protein MJ252_16630 [archaeon]|nr:hypothetical protein [archaeon]